MKIKYLDASMFGTYWIDAELLEILPDNMYKIKFYDDYSEEWEEKIVPQDRIEVEISDYQI